MLRAEKRRSASFDPSLPLGESAPWWKTGRGWAAGGIFLIAMIVTRFLDLARQSPWNDEVANWIQASELPAAITSTHRLTYWTIRAFTSIKDDVFHMRLPMALLMTATGLLVFSWIWKRLSPVAAGIFAALFVVSPMAITYSQDANHYAYVALAGAIGLVGSAWFWTEKPSWKSVGGALLALVGIAFASKAHEFIKLPLGGLIAALGIGMIVIPARLPLFGKLPAKAVRAALCAIAGVVLLAGVYLLMQRAGGMRTGRIAGAVYFEAVPEFQLRLLSDFAGAYMWHEGADYLAGFLAFAACVYGWTRLVRRWPAAWGPVVYQLVLVVTIFAVFTTFEFSHSFHVRYLIFLLPGFLVGWALAAFFCLSDWLVWREGRSPQGPERTFVPLAWVGIALFLFVYRAAVWSGAYYAGHFQPALPAMEWIAKNTPPDAIVGTRSQFLANAINGLNRRFPENKRNYVWLGESMPSTRNAAQQARMLAVLNPGKVYTLDNAWQDEVINVDYHQFAYGESKTLMAFPSWTEKDFFGFSRTIMVRQVTPPADFGALPQRGADAVQVYPMDSVFIQRPANEENNLATTVPAHLALEEGSGATYFLKASAQPRTIFIETTRVLDELPLPRWLVAADSHGRVFAWLLDAKPAQSPMRLDLPATPAGEPGERLSLFFPRVSGIRMENGREALLEINGLSDKNNAPDGFSIMPSVFEEERAAQTTPSDFGADGTKRLTPPVGAALELATSAAELGNITEPLLVLFRAETTGLSSGALFPSVAVEPVGGQAMRSPVFGDRRNNTSSTIGEAVAAYVVLPIAKEMKITAKIGVVPRFNESPHGGDVRFSAPRIGRLARPAAKATTASAS